MTGKTVRVGDIIKANVYVHTTNKKEIRQGVITRILDYTRPSIEVLFDKNLSSYGNNYRARVYKKDILVVLSRTKFIKVQGEKVPIPLNYD